MAKPHNPAVVKKVRALFARASDPGASLEEQRTSAHIAVKLCREHGIDISKLGVAEPAAVPPLIHERAELTVNGVHTVIEVIRSSATAALGFDPFAFAQELLRERTKEAISATLKKPAPRRPRRARRPTTK